MSARIETPVDVLVVAQAPVPGRAKTRLGAVVGDHAAATLAAAALRDTLAAAWEYAGEGRCHVALEGDLDDGVDADALREALEGWQVRPQRGDDFASRLVAAHADLADLGRPVLQIGMDTPQVTPALLAEVADGLQEHDAVLAPAVDGGWWALALRDPARADVLRFVQMSTEHTRALTHNALEAGGLRVADAPALIDVDEVVDAEAVAREAPESRFARAWRAVHPSSDPAASNHTPRTADGREGADREGGSST